MIYQLSAFEEWIEDINPENLLTASEDDLKELLRLANGEKNRIFSYFRDKAIGKPPQPTREFIHTHQETIAIVSVTLMAYAESVDGVKKNFYRSYCLILEDLIHFIQRHLPAYFDNEANITAINADLSKKKFVQDLKELQHISELPNVDTALYSMAIRPIRQYVDDDKPISYRGLSYLKELTHALKQLIYLDAKADITYEIHLILLQLNFNHSRYVLHYCYWLDANLTKISDRTTRLDALSKHIQAIEHMEYSPSLTFNPQLPPLKEQLLNAIKTTYQYLLTNDIPVNHAVIEQIETSSQRRKTKIRLSISVPVLALLIKICMKSGIILNESRNEVLRIIVDNFTTVRSEKLSFGSLKGKFNKAPPSAYLGIKDFVNKILEYLRKV